MLCPGPLPTERLGIYRDHTMEGEWLERHCTTLGLRTRRLHDARRSFISLSQDDGADPSVIRRITHPGEGDVFSSYTTYSWARLCGEVAKLNIRAPEASAKLPEAPQGSRWLCERQKLPRKFQAKIFSRPSGPA